SERLEVNLEAWFATSFCISVRVQAFVCRSCLNPAQFD
nr:hypothetical protein [Tanacetum cinerariifolium]